MLKDLCACEILDKQGVTKIKVFTEAKKFKKFVTMVQGIDKAQIDQTTKELKHKLACGGTHKDGVIILQGDHKKKVLPVLKQYGYREESIEIR